MTTGTDGPPDRLDGPLLTPRVDGRSSDGADGPLLPDGIDAQVTRIVGGRRADGHAVHLAVASIGDVGRPAVVLAHGVGSSARFVAAACAGPVVAAGWRLVTYDARGHGASSACPDPADHHLDAHVDDLDAVCAAAGPLAAVGGISLGGHAALRWHGDEVARNARDGAPRGPDDGALRRVGEGVSAPRRADDAVPRVVCLPAWIGRAEAGAGPHAAIADEVRAVGVAGLLERLRRDAEMAGWLRDTLATDYARHDPDSLAAALVALDGADGPDVGDVARIGAPVAVVAWRDDPGHPFAVAEQVAAVATDGRLVELAIADLEASVTRLGDAVVAALRAVAPSRGGNR